MLTSLTGCGPKQISGVYVSHNAGEVNMLQLSQSPDGHLIGNLNSVSLNADGKIASNNWSISNGSFDGGELTLVFSSSNFQRNMSGSKKGSLIRLNIIDASGNVQTAAFQRSSTEEFEKYANELKIKSQGIGMTKGFNSRTQDMHGTVVNAEVWSQNAEVHSQRIPNAKTLFTQIEDKMRLLIGRERTTSDSFARGKIAFAVGQGDFSAGQMDFQIDQTWDPIISDGSSLKSRMSNAQANCNGDHGGADQGSASSDVYNKWLAGCRELKAEKSKFDQLFEHILAARTDEKSFQVQAQSRRRALVNEANHIE
jgi:hypothetical protein